MTGTPLISVIVPTHGRRESLLRLLRSLTEQRITMDAFEVVVVCDGDIDGSAAACAALLPFLTYNLHVIEQANQGPAVARNRGVQEARHQLIVFLDDDVLPSPDLLAAHREAHAADECLVTIGPLLPPTDMRLSVWADWEERMLCRQYEGMRAGRWTPTYRQFYTGNAALRRTHILGGRGFDAAFRRAEDVELALRLHERGMHFTFLPDAEAWHYVERDFESWERIGAAYGEADVAMARTGRPHVLGMIGREFKQRHLLVRLATRCCVAHQGRMRLATSVFRAVVRSSNRWYGREMGRYACGLLFNLRYYDGMARALGGRRWFDFVLQGDVNRALTQVL